MNRVLKCVPDWVDLHGWKYKIFWEIYSFQVWFCNIWETRRRGKCDASRQIVFLWEEIKPGTRSSQAGIIYKKIFIQKHLFESVPTKMYQSRILQLCILCCKYMFMSLECVMFLTLWQPLWHCRIGKSKLGSHKRYLQCIARIIKWRD